MWCATVCMRTSETKVEVVSSVGKPAFGHLDGSECRAHSGRRDAADMAHASEVNQPEGGLRTVSFLMHDDSSQDATKAAAGTLRSPLSMAEGIGACELAESSSWASVALREPGPALTDP
jgi:hypothetical protein